MEATAAAIVGREQELDRLARFIAAPTARALVVCGDPGIGKTTVWEAAVEAARAGGAQVLSARANEVERELSFTGLGDLLDPVDLDRVDELAPPRRHALAVALLREDAHEEPPDRRALGVAVFDVLRGLAAERRVVVAVDDAQWLDAASAEILTFAARRLEGHPVLFLLARRPAAAVALERALEPPARVELAGLSLGALRLLLRDRLDLSPTRRELRRIHDLTRGNPFYALELGRVLAEHGRLGVSDELPLPGTLEELLVARVETLEPDMKRLVLAVALAGSLRSDLLEKLSGDSNAALDEVVSSGFAVLDENDLRPAHPLLAAALVSTLSAGERRRLHRELAALAEAGVAARHLALATTGPDEDVATAAAVAAAAAQARGAFEEAVELGEHALRLSPPGEARAERVVALAQALYDAGELQRMHEVLDGELPELPHGSPRARAHLLLSVDAESMEASERHLEQGLVEAAADPPLRAVILAERSMDLSIMGLERLEEVERLTCEAAALAGNAPDPRVTEAVAWLRLLRGQPLDGLVPVGADTPSRDRVLRVVAIQAAFRGEIPRARRLFDELLARAEERGQLWLVEGLEHQRMELALRTGDCVAAASLLAEYHDSYEDVQAIRSHGPRLRAVLAATRGEADDADALAQQALEAAATDRFLVRWDWLEAQRARGLAALQRGRSEEATSALAAVWSHCTREGIDDPGAFPVAPDLVEALVGAGELEDASRVAERLRRLAVAQRHPWALASVRRCEGLIALAERGHEERGIEQLERATRAYAKLGLRFDEARTGLSLGRSLRRRRSWGAARRTLQRAASVFGELGADGWQRDAAAELERVGARRPRAQGELTPAELRVAELAAAGLANKEIAQRLVVTVHTVELHLSHVYAKLGVRSRAQVGARLAAAKD